ncbi:DUF1127 domain-containing protein [Aestuariibius sp. HNIBRBA575]|uniref:DUF1127 domain-containing protein n=1 Tax=Aestuariibius sp. HNIBRBA575 TaxID=3233343 RepID=UPI0034A2E71F
MAVFETTRPAAIAPRSAGFFAQIVGAFAAWNDARITRNALSKLSARELEDIGLVRGDIDRIASSDYY